MPPIWKPQTKEVIESWIKALEEEASDDLTAWEIRFIESIKERIGRNSPLTQDQEEKLEEIYAEKTP